MFTLNYTLIIVLVTVLISITAFRNQEVFDRFKFNAWMIKYRKDYIRFISHGFLHADVAHLAINMYVLYSFGSIVEEGFFYLFGPGGRFIYLAMYVLAIIISSL